MSENGTQTLVGSILDGGYRIVRLLGEGGMGAVYEAVKLPLNNPVAVKVMARELAARTDTLKRFHREAEITSHLGHPHIVQVFDFGVTPTGEPFLVMELLRGEDLYQRIQRVGRLSPQQTLHVIKQIASALAATHAKDVVHRDLKPASIFILAAAGETDFIKVLDFGISKVRTANTQLTQNLVRMGTPSYMSPEQAMGDVDAIDGATDQWALACIAWECLSGRGPFVGDTNALLFQVVNVEPPPLAPKVPGLRPEIDQILRRALAKKKQDRFPSVTEFALALENAVLGTAPSRLPSATAPTSPTLRLDEGNPANTTFTHTAGEVDGSKDGRRLRPGRRWGIGAGFAAILLSGTLWIVGSRSNTKPVSAARPETLPTAPVPPVPTAPAPAPVPTPPPAAPEPTPPPPPPPPVIEDKTETPPTPAKPEIPVSEAQTGKGRAEATPPSTRKSGKTRAGDAPVPTLPETTRKPPAPRKVERRLIEKL
jgi:serine/threonine protein kinase